MVCYRCKKQGHVCRDCRVQLEGANCGMVVRGNKELTAWTRSVLVNGAEVTALLDTRCTKSIVHPRCIGEEDQLLWNIAYNTASSKQVYLPLARIRLQKDDGRSDEMAVGVPEHIDVDMLLGHDIPQFRKYVRKVLDVNPPEVYLTLLAPKTTPQSSMVTTRSQQKAQDQLEETEQLQ